MGSLLGSLLQGSRTIYVGPKKGDPEIREQPLSPKTLNPTYRVLLLPELPRGFGTSQKLGVDSGSERAQYPSIKEHTLNHNKNNHNHNNNNNSSSNNNKAPIIQGIYPLVKVYWALWVPRKLRPGRSGKSRSGGSPWPRGGSCPARGSDPPVLGV